MQLPSVWRQRPIFGTSSTCEMDLTVLGSISPPADCMRRALNGFRVGDAVLTPGWTDYSVRLQYQAYDVTSMLCSGINAMGAMLGDGWYCGYFGFRPKRSGAHYGEHPELLAQLSLRYLDGTSEWIATDKSWKTNWGEIMHADPLMGECHFSGLHPTGWDTAGFDDKRWFSVLARGRDTTSIVADPGPPIRITDVIAPLALPNRIREDNR